MGSAQEDRANLLMAASEALVKKGFNCGKVLSEAAAFGGGSGGGRPDMAQGGAKDKEKIKDIIEKGKELIIREIK